MIWHKIVCRRDVGKNDIYRPTYSHVLCYSITGTTGSAFADVFPCGDKLYANATPENVTDRCLEFIKTNSKLTLSAGQEQGYDIVDPFIGRGTTLKYALKHNLTCLGIDIDPLQCDHARQFIPIQVPKIKIKLIGQVQHLC